MTVIVSKVSVSEAAAIINVIVMFLQYSLPLAVVVVLIRFIPRINSALSWSTVSRTLNSTLWPMLLRSDGETSGDAVGVIAWLSLFSTIFVTLSGVLLPLGLGAGPLQHGNFREITAEYLPDNSPLAAATTPYRDQFTYARICGYYDVMVCATGSTNLSTAITATNLSPFTIPPGLIEIFNSTPFSPFSLQYRLFSQAPGALGVFGITVGALGTSETFIMRNDTFLAEGLIIDMSSSSPGIGLLNHTVPTNLAVGGVWSQQVLWLEPVTACVNTNLTVDYTLNGVPGTPISPFYLTDRGGFVNLTSTAPPLFSSAMTQGDINLADNAFKAAFYSNLVTMTNLNLTQDSSALGNAYPLDDDTGGFLANGTVGQMAFIPFDYLTPPVNFSMFMNTICTGWGSTDQPNITNIGMECGVFLGPASRVDGGDPLSPKPGSQWSQELHACASSTRASVQWVQFSTNDTSNLENIQVSQRETTPVLWGLEQTSLDILDIDPLWGSVDDVFESDPAIWSTRSDYFYLPAGTAGFLDDGLASRGFPASTPSAVWGSIYSNWTFKIQGYTDYSGQSNLAMKSKFQSLMQDSGSDVGQAEIRNLIWTDIMANAIIGSRSNTTLLTSPNLTSLEYDFKFSIFGILLLLIWLPSLIVVLALFALRSLTFKDIRLVLNHISVGRVVVGTSVLRVVEGNSEEAGDMVGAPMTGDTQKEVVMSDTSTPIGGGWTRRAEERRVVLAINPKNGDSIFDVDFSLH